MLSTVLTQLHAPAHNGAIPAPASEARASQPGHYWYLGPNTSFLWGGGVASGFVGCLTAALLSALEAPVAPVQF